MPRVSRTSCTACLPSSECPGCAQVREFARQFPMLGSGPAVCANHDPDRSLHVHICKVGKER